MKHKIPVVALESTIIAHGFPYPANAALATEIEQTVRDCGAVPATIAVVEGRIWVGLESEVREQLAHHGHTFRKAGAADIAVHLARKASAATTVSATAMIAARTGIAVFATGGIGGVHRGDNSDVSHDLLALSRVKLAVVSAGAKAILDLARTVEMLETLGVLVVGFRCDDFPAFYTTSSGIKLEHRFDDIVTIALALNHHWNHCDGAGALICNPIPAAAALPANIINACIEQALCDASAAAISGKALTPFLLSRLAKVTDGQSIVANRALALNNAVVASQLAVALSA